MKKTLLYLSVLLMVMMASCKKDTEAVTDLLKTVPSSAGGVVVLDIEGLIEATGSEIKDNQISLSKDMEACLSTFSQSNRNDLMMLLDGSSGILPKAAVVFYDSSRTFLTFSLYDEEKFIQFVEKVANGKFTNATSKVRILGNTAVMGSQAWVLLKEGRRLDPDAIEGYSNLKTSQSFLVTPIGEDLLIEENNIRGWTLIGTYLDEMLDRTNRALFSMGAGFVFENAESVKFKADFKKGELEASLEILNDKYKPAKYLLPTNKVDVATLKGLGETCDAMMAFTVNKTLIEKFNKLGAAFGGAMFGDLGDGLKSVDGTVGIVTGAVPVDNSMSANENGTAMNGVVTTNGNVSQELKNFISQNLGTVSEEGNLIKFSKGAVSGDLKVEECAEELKGGCLGIVISKKNLKNSGMGSILPKGFKYVVALLEPDSGGLKLEIEAKTDNPEENALVVFMKGEF